MTIQIRIQRDFKEYHVDCMHARDHRLMPFALRILVLLLSAGLVAARAEVRVWQGTMLLPTYEEGPPDPNPPFDLFATSRFNYPYTLRNNLTGRRVAHEWRAIYLENEYLKCSVLPDIGGHLYTCVDKINGQPIFYANPSIKKAEIGYRGAWAAFGVEFNFPVSHNWVSMSPVDFAFTKHEDGSASVTVGNIDRVYGMQWAVELVLRPQSTVLEQRVTLNNRSDVRHRFYWWNNAGVEVWDDSRIQYPMRFAASHGFTEVQPWPVEADGTDLSLIRNQTKGPVSLFVHGSREPFMGVWNPRTNSGIVHFANYAELPAKKVWSWGVDADGLDWRKTLSDNDSVYVEVQAGLFRNQETYAFLQPRQSISFSEYWMPVRELGGISRANLSAIVHLSRKDDALLIGLNVNHAVKHASLRLLDGKQQIFQENADLSPERVWLHQVRLAKQGDKYSFELRDDHGGVLLRQTEEEYDWTPAAEIRVGPQASYPMPAAEKRSEDDWIQLGNQQELDGELLQALRTYKQALAKYPDSLGGHKAAGRLCASLLRFDEAKSHLEVVHARDTSDAEVSYYLGIAYEALGESRAARGAFEAAHLMPDFKAAGALRLGELSARDGELGQAESYLQEALMAAPNDVRTAEELAAVRRALAKPAARDFAQEWLARFPQSYFLREQLGAPDLNHFSDDADRVLNLAGLYMRLGMYQPALEVLSRKYPAAVPDETEPGSLPPQLHPLVAYFRAYCMDKLGQPASAAYQAASELSTAYVFPNGAQELDVLRAALRENAEDGKARYLLGTLYFSLGLTEEALVEWNVARKFTSGLPVLHTSMGRALLQVKNDPEQALAVFREGLGSDGNNVELYVGIDQTLSLLKRSARERVEALELYPERAKMPTRLIYELILNLAEARDYDTATALFRDRFFAREEGGTNVREVWIEVQLQRALGLAHGGRCSEALSAVEQLPSEVPGLLFTRDGLEPILRSARTKYLAGEAYESCGEAGKAKSRFELAAAQFGPDQIVWAYMSARKLPGFEQGQWQLRLKSALESSRNIQTSWGFYNRGLTNDALGHAGDAEADFRQALLMPDGLLAYHLTRLALAQHSPALEAIRGNSTHLPYSP
jgi:Flp pilus assembly protein TadD